MSTETQNKSSLAAKVKGLLGVEDDVKLKPMIAYNSAISWFRAAEQGFSKLEVSKIIKR